MKTSKLEGKKVIILSSTNQRCAKIIDYFLKKNSINCYDEIIFRKKFWQKESDYKIEEMQKNNICLHYEDGVEVCVISFLIHGAGFVPLARLVWDQW